MELHELHVDELGPGLVSQSMPIARVLPRIAGDLPRFANAASRQDDGASAKQHEATGFAEVPQRSGHSSTPYKQAHNRAFHVHIEPGMHGLVLEDAEIGRASCRERV